MIIKKNVSYSRYRGPADDWRYDAIDDYFKYEVNGNVICTDTEQDIDCDGNIILLTPEGDCIHLGEVPILEEGAGKPSFKMDSKGNLHLSYKFFYDCSHHHFGIESDLGHAYVPNKK